MSSAQVSRWRSPQPATVVWLTLVWVVLWGDLSALTLVGGVLVAVAVCLVFPLPPLGLSLRIRPLRMGWLAVRFLGDVVVASLQVAWTTLQFHRQPRNAVIEVDLRTHSDFILTVVAEIVSLVPGSLVVEARRSTHTERFVRWTWVVHGAALAAAGRQAEAADIVRQGLAKHPELSVEWVMNDPSWTEKERQTIVAWMRPAGFPACAPPDAMAEIANPRRLPECAGATGRLPGARRAGRRWRWPSPSPGRANPTTTATCARRWLRRRWG